MKTVRRVGGPLLGDREWFRYEKELTPSHHYRMVVPSWDTFEPILTPLIGRERFCILPHGQFISVTSHRTGRFLAHLIPNTDSEDRAVKIHSVSLARVGRVATSKASVQEQLQDSDSEDSSDEEDVEMQDALEHVVLVGCSNGSIQEFSLTSLLVSSHSSVKDTVGEQYNLSGPCHGPRRVFVVSENPLLHMTVPPMESSSGALVYALADQGLTSDKKIKAGKVKEPKDDPKKGKTITAEMALLRIVLPPYNNNDEEEEEDIDLTKDEDADSAVQKLDRFKCRLRGSHYNSFPFRLVSTARPSNVHQNQDVFVTVGRSTSISIYHEQVSDHLEVVKPSTQTQAVLFQTPPQNPMTALATCTMDLACGHAEGDIRIWHNVFTNVLEYQEALAQQVKGTTPPPHPAHSVIVKRLHWHAHAVTTLSYYNTDQDRKSHASPALQDSMLLLYSGGIEAVLIMWQPSRGTYRPADILPRLAKGGIVHICNNGSTVLVYSEDNSLQLLQSHNQSLVWKQEGLPNATPQEQSQVEMESSICPDPLMGNNMVLRGMVGSPGYLHWYNASQQCVIDKLEVVPYNRVSRTERKDKPMPAPAVLHSSFAKNGKQLVTVDAVWSENRYSGATVFSDMGPPLGVTHTIRFWTKTNLGRSDSMPYELSAAMTNPHGRENLVSAMALSSDGQYVCTVSNDEHAFRVWHRVEVADEDEEEGHEHIGNKRIMSWVCQYKITTPSGYSNLRTSRNGVAFSSDGSLLAICYGNIITLWDHNDATLVTTMRHLDDDDSPIDSIQFVKTAYLHDLLLTKSRNGVTLQTLFENVQDTRWSYNIFANHEYAHVSHAELLPTHDIVAVSLYLHYNNTSQIILLDAVTGDPKTIKKGKKKVNLTWFVRGHVRAMGPSSDKVQRTSAWTDVSSTKKEQPPEPPIQLYVLMNDGEMLLLQADAGAGDKALDDDDDDALLDIQAATTPGKRRTMLSATDAPVLNLPTSRKRPKTTVSINEDTAASNKSNDNMFGFIPVQDGAPAAPLPSSDLPVLSSAFTRAFLGKKLVRSLAAADRVD